MLRELALRSIPSITQQLVQVEYKGLIFDETAALRFNGRQLLARGTKGRRSFASIQQERSSLVT